jgi:hypothetical protein
VTVEGAISLVGSWFAFFEGLPANGGDHDQYWAPVRNSTGKELCIGNLGGMVLGFRRPSETIAISPCRKAYLTI